MALSPRPIYEPQQCVCSLSQGHSSLVLSREHLPGMERQRFITLDPWHMCAMSNFFLDTTSCRTISVVGSGKSVLWFVDLYLFFFLSGLPISFVSCKIIQDIAAMCRAGQASMAYFDFDFRDINKQHLHDLIPSLLCQLSAYSRSCRTILADLYEDHDSGRTQPSDLALVDCLKHMLFSLRNRGPIYLVMDALDECPDTSGIPSPRARVLQLVKELVELRLSSLHICVTSRPEVDIRNVLEPLTSLRLSLHDQIGQKWEIWNYIESIVYSDSEPCMRNWEAEHKKLVTETLSEGAGGV